MEQATARIHKEEGPAGRSTQPTIGLDRETLLRIGQVKCIKSFNLLSTSGRNNCKNEPSCPLRKKCRAPELLGFDLDEITLEKLSQVQCRGFGLNLLQKPGRERCRREWVCKTKGFCSECKVPTILNFMNK